MHAFFDDGLSFRGNGLILMAGYVADETGWEGFARDWKIALDKHGLQWLHTSDFLSQEGDYRGMGLSDGQRIDAVRDFILVTRKHVQAGFGIGLDSVAFKEYVAALPKAQKSGKPEDFLFLRTLRLCMNHMEALDLAEPIQIVFDDSTEDSMRHYGAYRRVRRKHPDLRNKVIGISFCDDRFVYPVQAADMLACIVGREFAKGEHGWAEGSPWRDVLLAEDPAYGLLFHNELWNREAIFGHPDLAAILSDGATRASASLARSS